MPSATEIIYKLAISGVPVFLAITVHEMAHGWAGYLLGDKTPKIAGRLSLNPLKHIDLVGTLIIPGIMLILGGFLFGWAKPIPLDTSQLKNPQKDIAVIAAAGPLANIALGLAWAILYKISLGYVEFSRLWTGVNQSALFGVFINSAFAVIHLLPIPPLAGGRILIGILPIKLAVQMSKLERYGFIVVLVLMVSGILGAILTGPMESLSSLILALVGVH